MFDNLIRRDPRDSGKTIIPDLAHSWEIAKDGKTYTFHLRKDVQFHDGAELTSEDVKATFDRIAKPPSGVSIPRSTLFTTVERDHRAGQVHRASSSSPSRGRPPSSWRRSPAAGTCIVRKKTLEDNQYNLRRVVDYPRHRPVQEQAPRRERSLGDGEERQLLEQGPALSRRHRVLPRPAVLARAGLGDPVQPRRLCPHRRSR